MPSFTYVYILTNHSGKHHYTGVTNNLERRLREHNSRGTSYTVKHGPWTLQTAIAFRSRKKALAFERYLKSHSGRAFAAKHF